ncbi:hypothetical protein L492_3947 [Bordetella bronchiseptica 7E71]|nr:hypothetical protein L492_3947 [Bordetella bronchiseptica 7E71]
MLPPKGALLPWGGPAVENAPTLRSLRELAAPQGGSFALGRPGGKRCPHAALAARACCPPRELFCLGAARR